MLTTLFNCIKIINASKKYGPLAQLVEQLTLK